MTGEQKMGWTGLVKVSGGLGLALTAYLSVQTQIKQAELTSTNSAVRETIAKTAPVTNACIEEVKNLRVEFELERRLHGHTRSNLHRLRDSAVLRRGSAEWTARELRLVEGETFVGPEATLATALPPPLDLPKL